MANVLIEKVRKAYGALEVVHGVDIEVADGEFVVLVGPSGCGKTTLLRMIAGLERISGGEIRIDDRVVNEIPPKDRDIAMVFQNYALYPHMTVADNMSFALWLRGMSKAERKQQVFKAAEILGLTNLLNRYPRQLSGGQRQRVAMGRAIVRNPKVFLFDEPLSNLDAKLRVQMRTEIKDLHQRLKTTTIYVTHDQVEAMTMADRIVVMNNGNVEQIGAPLELYDNPRNVFVASFIGSPSMNLIDGRISGGDTPAFVAQEGTRVFLAHGIPGPEREAVLGVRPEHLGMVPVGTAGAMEGIVVAVEPTGPETLVVARSVGRNITAIFRERVDVKPGERIALLPREDCIHVFNAAPRPEAA